MNSRIVFLTVLAIVVQSSTAELPSALTSDFSKILSAEILTRNGFTAAFDGLFDEVIKAYEGKKSDRSQSFREVVAAFVDANDGIMQAVETLEVEGETSVTVNETAVNAGIEQIVGLCFEGLDLAVENADPFAIETVAETVISAGKDFVENVFAVVLSISVPETGVIAAIESTQAVAINDVTIAFRTYFTALEILRVAVSSEHKSGDGLSAILLNQRLAVSVMEDEVATEFDMFRILSIINYAGQNEIGVYFSAIVSGQEATFNGFKKGFENIFSAILGYNSGETDSSIIANSAKKTSTAFIAAYDGIEEAIQAVQFKNYIATDQDAANAAIEYAVEQIYDAIKLARSSSEEDSSGNLAEIAAIETEVIDEVVAIFESIFQEVATASSKDYNVVARIESTETDAIADVTFALRAAFKSIKFIATSACSKSQTRTLDDSIAIIVSELVTSLVMKKEAYVKFNLLRDLLIAEIVNGSEIPADS